MCANICFPHWSWQICSWKSLHTERGKGREGWGREREKFSLELSKLNPSYSPRGIGNWNLRQFYVFFFSLFSHFCSSNEATADLPRLTCPFMFKWAADLTLCFVELSKLLIPCAFDWPQEDEREEKRVWQENVRLPLFFDSFIICHLHCLCQAANCAELCNFCKFGLTNVLANPPSCLLLISAAHAFPLCTSFWQQLPFRATLQSEARPAGVCLSSYGALSLPPSPSLYTSQQVHSLSQ